MDFFWRGIVISCTVQCDAAVIGQWPASIMGMPTTTAIYVPTAISPNMSNHFTMIAASVT
jgi:hypothetical protein